MGGGTLPRLDNYTITFSTGYSACLPGTQGGGARTRPSDENGQGMRSSTRPAGLRLGPLPAPACASRNPA